MFTVTWLQCQHSTFKIFDQDAASIKLNSSRLFRNQSMFSVSVQAFESEATTIQLQQDCSLDSSQQFRGKGCDKCEIETKTLENKQKQNTDIWKKCGHKRFLHFVPFWNASIETCAMFSKENERMHCFDYLILMCNFSSLVSSLVGSLHFWKIKKHDEKCWQTWENVTVLRHFRSENRDWVKIGA